MSVSDGGLQLALVVNASMTFMILGLATERFFRCPTASAPWRLRAHRIVAMVCSLLHVLSLATVPLPRPRAMAASFVIYFAGLAMFFWSQETVKDRPPALTFSSEPPDALWLTGPFALVRHPFYVAYSLIWWAGAIGSGNPWVVGSAAWMSAAYVIAAREEERAFEAGPWGDAYRRYAARTGRWLPNLERATGITVSGRVRALVRAAAAIAIVTALVALLFTTDVVPM